MDPGDMKAGMPLRVPQNVLEEGLGQLRGQIALGARYRLKNLLGRGECWSHGKDIELYD